MKPPKPLTAPVTLQITPRLLAAAEASMGRRLPPGTLLMAVPPPENANLPSSAISDLLKRTKPTF
jgi:hypothetical protein